MVLAKARVESFEKFWQVFSTIGAEHRAKHGSKGSQVYQDSGDPNTVWVMFNWDRSGYEGFIADPKTKEIFQKGGLQGPPEPIFLDHSGEADA
ncbi:MAG TPA: hypothetical protein VM841_15680 [Actinomycetota bacterium]|nr:hypothetical protein [Actinomycetota bacterium]